MSHAFTNVLLHIVFGTRERLPQITSEIRPELHAYLGGMVRECEGETLIINGTSDHVHLLARIATKIAISEAMSKIKANSSRWIHENWPASSSFAWQTGYGAFSVSASNVAAVSEYIRTQEEHHRRMSFEQEFIELLRRHGVQYDPGRLWE